MQHDQSPRPKQDKRSGGAKYQDMKPHEQTRIDRIFNAVLDFVSGSLLKHPPANECEELRESIAIFVSQCTPIERNR